MQIDLGDPAFVQVRPELDRVGPRAAQEHEEPPPALDSLVQAANEPKSAEQTQVDLVHPVTVPLELDRVDRIVAQAQQEPHPALDSNEPQSLDQMLVHLADPAPAQVLDRVDPIADREQQE